MIKMQKIIKYFAVAFALFITFNIISMITYGISSLGNILDINENNEPTGNLEKLDIKEIVKILDIEITSSNVIFQKGTTFDIETNNEYINFKQNNGKVTITEQKHNWLNKSNDSNLIIYVPSDYTFDGVSIENGAGKINIEKLTTKKLELDLGAGQVNINNLIVTNKTEINGGAGEINITKSNLSNLDLDMGVGKLTLTSIIDGNSEIDAGIGELNLNLIGETIDYKIIIDKGIGNATLDGENMKNSTYYGNGNKLIDIDGGIGSIKINFISN